MLSAGDERPPWRASRRHVLAALAALLLAACAAGGVGWRRHQAQERRLDRAAVAALSLIVVDDPLGFIDDGDDVAVELRNDGRQPVRIRSARVDFPGYRQIPLSAALTPYAATRLRIASTPSCGPAVVTMGQLDLLVGVVTVRGTARQLRLPLLAGSTGLFVRSRAREVCAMMPTAQAVTVSAALARSSSREAVLDLTLENLSVLPVTLQAIGAGPGLQVTAESRLPVALPARTAPRTRASLVSVLVRVTPTNCPIVVGRTRLTAELPLGDLSLGLARGAQRSTSSVGLDPPVAAAIKALAKGCARSARAVSGDAPP